MKVTPVEILGGKLSGRTVYVLDGTAEEKAAYKKAQGIYYRERDGKPTYLAFEEEVLSTKKEYVLNEKGRLTVPVSEEMIALNDKLADYQGISVEKLQKLNQIKALEAGVI